MRGVESKKPECDLPGARFELLQRPTRGRAQGVRELHIGHWIVSRSVLIECDAVREMKTLIREMAR